MVKERCLNLYIVKAKIGTNAKRTPGRLLPRPMFSSRKNLFRLGEALMRNAHHTQVLREARSFVTRRSIRHVQSHTRRPATKRRSEVRSPSIRAKFAEPPYLFS